MKPKWSRVGTEDVKLRVRKSAGEEGPGGHEVSMLLSLFVSVCTIAAQAIKQADSNTAIAKAYTIDKPDKKCTFYEKWTPGDSGYLVWRFARSAGQDIVLSLTKPISTRDQDLALSITLMQDIGTANNFHRDTLLHVLPKFVSEQEFANLANMQLMWHLDSNTSGLHKYEGFGPSSYQQLGAVSLSAPAQGTPWYYLLVANPSRCAANSTDDCVRHWGVTIGSKKNVNLGLLLTHAGRMRIVRDWERQSSSALVLPFVASYVLFLGAWLWLRRRRLAKLNIANHARLAVWQWLCLLAAVCYWSSAFNLFVQLLVGVRKVGKSDDLQWLVTGAVICAHVGLAVYPLRSAMQSYPVLRKKQRAMLAVVAIVSYFIGAGLYLGPSILLLAVLLPPRCVNRAPSVSCPAPGGRVDVLTGKKESERYKELAKADFQSGSEHIDHDALPHESDDAGAVQMIEHKHELSEQPDQANV
eukprot:g54078.t1